MLFYYFIHLFVRKLSQTKAIELKIYRLTIGPGARFFIIDICLHTPLLNLVPYYSTMVAKRLASEIRFTLGQISSIVVFFLFVINASTLLTCKQLLL